MKRTGLIPCAILLIAGALAPRLSATTGTYVGTTNASWSTATNWTSNPFVPGTGDTAVFNNAGNGNTSITVGAITISTIRFDTGAAAYTLDGTAAPGTIIFDNGGGSAGNINVTAGVTTNQTINSNIVLGIDNTQQTYLFDNASASGTLVITGSVSASNSGGNKSLVLAGPGTGIISGPVSNGGGSVSVTINSGTWSISGNNTYTGTTVINGGLLKTGSNATAGIVLNSGTLQLTADNALLSTLSILSGTLAGAATKLDLNGHNQQFVNLTSGSNAANAQTQFTVATGSGMLTLTGSISVPSNSNQLGAVISGNLALVASTGTSIIIVQRSSANTPLTNLTNGYADLTISANISGTAINFANSNGSITVLGGNNTYTGSTVIGSQDVVYISNANALGTTGAGTTVASNATLGLVGGTTGITFAAEPLILNGAGTQTISGVPFQSGNLVNISGSNTWTGPITLSNGATISSDAGSLAITGTINGGGALTLSGSTGGNISGLIANTNSFTKNGKGTWIVSGAVTNTYTGATTVAGGTLLEDFSNMATPVNLLPNTGLNLSGGILSVLGKSSGTSSQSFGTLQVGFDTASTLVINPNGGTSTTVSFGSFSRQPNSSLLFSLNPSGTAGSVILKTSASATNGIFGFALVQDSSGTTGFAQLATGVITRYDDRTSATALAAASNSATVTFTTFGSVFTGGMLQMTNASRSLNALVVDSGTTGGIVDFGGAANIVTLSASAVLFRGSANATLQNGVLGASGSELIVHQVGSGTLNINTTISGAGGSLTVDGGGVVALGGANAYTGSTVVNSGTLVLNTSGSLSSNFVVVNKGTLVLNGGNMSSSGTLILGNSPGMIGNFDLNGNAETIKALIFGGNLADNGSEGNVVSSAPGGALTIAASGSIQYNNAGNPLGATISTNVVLSTGSTTISVAHSSGNNPDAIGAPGGGPGNADLTISGNISGAAGAGINFSTNGGKQGVLVLSGSNSYNGTTNVGSNAVLNIQSSYALNGTPTVSVVNNGVIQFQSTTGIALTAANGLTGGLSISGTGPSASGGVDVYYYSGAVMNISGNNTYGGPVALQGDSTLSVVGGTLNMSGSFTGAKGLTLTGAPGTSGTVSGNIATGGNSVNKNGFNTWTLTGTNTYTNQTNVNSGTLYINGDNSLATGKVVVAGGATLGGSGTLGGSITVAGGGTPLFQGNLSLVNGSIGKLTVGSAAVPVSMTLGSGTLGQLSNLYFELGNSSTDMIALTGTLNLNPGGAAIYLSQLAGTTLAPGLYPLLSFNSGTLNGSFTLATPTIGSNTFSLITSGTELDLLLRLSNNSALTITPGSVPLSLNILAGKPTSGTASATLTNTGTDGPADYTTHANGAVTVTPTTSAGNGGTGATLNPGDSQTLTITAGGNAPNVSGSNQVIGTVSATDLNNPTGNGDAAPINITANVYDSAAITPSGDHYTITNTSVGSNGANSLIASAVIQQNTLNGGATQNAAAWTMNTSTTPFATGSTVSVATFNPNAKIGGVGLLNGTYAAVTGLRVGNVMADGSQIGGATTGDVYTNFNYTLSGTVTGNKSSDVSDAYAADILTGSSYGGYSLGSSVPGTTHTATGHGGATTTVASIAYGTSSTGASMQMSFEGTPQPGDDITRASDILVMQPNSISILSQGSDNRYLTDMFVLQLSYDASDLGLAYIVQNTPDNIWVDTVVLNSNGTLVDDGGTSAKHESFSAYLLNDAPGGVPKLGDYGYFDGVAWAVIDHTATGDNNAEFAVVAAAVPEPGTYALLLGGFGVLAAFKTRRRSLL